MGPVHMDMRSGAHGIMSYTDGSSYTGAWHSNMRHGHGVLTFADGTSWQGEFSKDKRHGEGELRDKDGVVTESGIWANGAKVVQG